MILRVIITIIFTSFFVVPVFNTVSAQGNVPDVIGQIYNYDTGLLFASPTGEFGKNVWLQWKNNHGRSRYARTNNTTFYKFRSQEGNDWDDIFVRADTPTIECLTKKLCDGCTVQNSIGEDKCDVGEFTTDKDATFTCGGNPHSFSVVTPNLLEGQGSFYLRNTYGTAEPASSTTVNLHNGQREKVIHWDWVPNRPLAPPQCPKDLKVVCSQERNAGKIRADFTWSHDDYRPAGSDPDDVSQFTYVLRKSSLDFISPNVTFIMDPAYSGGSTLDASNKHVYALSTTQSMPVWLEEEADYTWMVQPGRRSWPIPYNNLWDVAPYSSPWCPAEPVNCGTTWPEPDFYVNSCVRDADGNYSSTATIDISSDFLPAFDSGELQLEFTVPEGGALEGLLTNFLGNSIVHREDSGITTTLRAVLGQVAQSDFDWSGGLFGNTQFIFPHETTIINNQSLTEFNEIMNAQGVNSLEQYTKLLFLKSFNGTKTVVGDDSIELICTSSVADCDDVYTQTSVNLIPSIQEGAQNLTISWTIGEGSTKQAFQNAISRYTLTLTGSDGSITRSAIDKSALSEDIPLTEIQEILGDSNELTITLVPYVETSNAPFEDACPVATRTDLLTYNAQVNVSLLNTSNSCGGLTTPNFQELNNLQINSQAVLDNPTSVTLPYIKNGSSVSLSGVPSDYFCAECNPLCQKNVSPESPSTTIYIHSGLIHSSWWQVMGGLIFAQNNLRSNLPVFSTGSSTDRSPACMSVECNPFLARANPSVPVSEENTSAGVVFSNAAINPTSTGASIFGWIRQANRQSYATDSNASHTADRYADFVSLVRPPEAQPVDTLTSLNSSGETRGTDVRIIHIKPASGTVTISTNLDVPDRKTIVFVDGNLRITGSANEKIITAPVGSFLSFIVSGNITFDQTVGQSSYTSEEPVVEGIYLANGTITTAGSSSDDIKFVGAGTFVGWGGVSLGRSFDDTTKVEADRINDKYPLELFIHRPDFVLNTPDVLKTTKTTWQEVN